MIRRSFTKFVRWIGYDLGISPNQITLGRFLFFVPGWLTWVFMHELAVRTSLPWQLFGVIALVVVTTVIVFDIVDGALARETGQVSDQGKVLDPLVDKLITYSCLALFWKDITQTGLITLLILDLMSTFLRGVQVEGANRYGKRKALAQNISKIFFGLAVLCALPWLNLIGNALIWLAVALATISVGIRVLPAKIKTSIQVAIPQALTLCNLGSGLATIWCATQGMIGLGVAFNFAAMLFDLADGAVARRLGVSSKFGGQFDTIADMISFGVAPAVLIMAVTGWSFPAIIIGLCYFIATITRLYDYGKSKKTTPAGFFRGLPSPAGAWLVVVSALFPQAWLGLVVMVIAAVLMCSFRINWIHFNRAFPSMTVTEWTAAIGLGLLLVLISKEPATFTAGPIILYVFSPQWRKPPPKLQQDQPQRLI